jgi:hypothetical protein
VQVTFAVHAEQRPLRQTMFVPQGLPSPTLLPVSVHWAAPLAQLSVPVWHLLAGGQAMPATQATHRPSPHTLPIPQPFPFWALPEGLHTGAPVVHSSLPVLHGSLTGQASPATHAMHTPLGLQTLSVPQEPPAAIDLPVSLHFGLPPAHSRVPSWHGSAGTHVLPGAQA